MLKPIIVISLTLLALGYFSWTIYRLWCLLRKGKPGFKFPGLGPAITDLLTMVLGQKKVLRWLYSGILHVFIFWGFLVLFTTIVEMYGEAFDHSFVFPLIGGTWTLAFLQELFAILVLVGITMAFCLRVFVRPKRYQGSDTADALVILACIAGIVITLFFMHALRYHNGVLQRLRLCSRLFRI